MNKLDQFFKKWSRKNPTDLQMQKWKTAVHTELKSQSVQSPLVNVFYFTQIIGSACAGLILGAFLFGQPLEEKSSTEKIFFEDATTEVIYTKL